MKANEWKPSCQILDSANLLCTDTVLFQENHNSKAVLGIFGEEREVNKVTGRLKVLT